MMDKEGIGAVFTIPLAYEDGAQPIDRLFLMRLPPVIKSAATYITGLYNVAPKWRSEGREGRTVLRIAMRYG